MRIVDHLVDFHDGIQRIFFGLTFHVASLRLVQIQHAPYLSFASLLKGLDLLIDRLKVPKCHMLGEGLGGYIAQCYAQFRPAKVASLVLCNTYSDMQHWVDSSPWSSLLSWMPDALMRRKLLSDYSYKGADEDISSAFKFVSQNAKSLDTDDLCSRLTLQYLMGPLRPTELPVSHESITIIDTQDPIAFPDRLRLEVHKFYPGSREVLLSTGSNFPFLSKSTEFNKFLEEHLTINGCQPFTTPIASSSSTPAPTDDSPVTSPVFTALPAAVRSPSIRDLAKGTDASDSEDE